MAHKGKNVPKALRTGLPHYDEQGGVMVGRKKVNLSPPPVAPVRRKRKGGS